jgi:predicted transcriptional regulator
MSETRNRIARQVRRSPGIHFNELTRKLDLAPGQVQYHLRKLERADDVVEESLYGRTHYYTPDYGSWERGALAVLRRETTRRHPRLSHDERPECTQRSR